MDVKTAIRVNKPPADLYQFWHDVENLPRCMEHLDSVQVTGDTRSHWTVQRPAGTTVAWDAAVVEDRPNELIVGRSRDGAAVDNTGVVMNRSLTIKTGQTHMQRDTCPLLERVQKGESDPSFVITHWLPLDAAPRGYKVFRDKEDDCLKVVLNP